MPAQGNGQGGLSRRTVITAAASSAALRPSCADPLVDHCRTWLSLNAEVNRLMTRWARCESTAMASFRAWHQQSETWREATVLGAEMKRIDEALPRIFESRDTAYQLIVDLPARSLNAATAKLAVASCLLEPADNEAAPLVTDALSVLLGHHCELRVQRSRNWRSADFAYGWQTT